MKRVIPLLVIIFISGSCTFRKTRKVLNVEDIYARAMIYFQRGKYSKAITYFNKILYEYPRSRYVDDAQYYLAESYLRSKDWDNAINEFKFFIQQFPNSEYYERAYIGLITAYISKTPNPELDQSDTKKGIRIARDYLYEHPNTKYREEIKALIRQGEERLALKLYLISETYRHLKQYNAEKIYLEYLLDQYPHSEIAQKARERLAECNKRLNSIGKTVSTGKFNPKG